MVVSYTSFRQDEGLEKNMVSALGLGFRLERLRLGVGVLEAGKGYCTIVVLGSK